LQFLSITANPRPQATIASRNVMMKQMLSKQMEYRV